MREILFRGKDKKTGEWVVGGYHKHLLVTHCPMHPPSGSPEQIESVHLIIKSGFSDWNLPRTINCYHVIPETVGQYTGLKDKNGKEIYEGDILGQIAHWSFIVEFENGAFRVAPLDIVQRRNWEHKHLTQEWLNCGYEVIGNIHDNPELLEGEE